MTDKRFACRKITESDLIMMMNWRLQPDVTKYMNTDPVITWKEQKTWFDKISQTDFLPYWIINVNEVPSGVINLADIDQQHKRCTWGYYVAVKSARSFNLAVALELSLYEYGFEVLLLNKITGESLAANKAAIKLHELCGCETEGVLKQHIFKNNTFHDIVVQSMTADRWHSVRDGLVYQRISFE